MTRAFLILISGCLIGGCSPLIEVEASDAALFCDVEEPRRFTQNEIDWRTSNAPANLRLDFQTNLTWDRECAAQ